MAKVLGMGNALVDIMTQLISDETLELFSLPKGSMQLVDHNVSHKVNNGTNDLEKQIASGGSAANTIHGLAKLGIETGFVGKVGKDDFGKFFSEDLIKSKIQPELLISETPTGKAMALISPDSERTFATYLGAAVELSADDLSDELFKGYDYFHIEGYLVQNHELLEKAVKLARQNNLTICLDLASYNVVEDNIDFLQQIVKDYVDIVFANEEEAKAITGKQPEEALEELAQYCKIAVVKVGKNGSFVKRDDEKHSIGVIAANSIDTTGAGDLYASGFIYGLCNGLSLDQCGAIGSVLSGKVIEVIGPKMDDQKWQEVQELLEKI